MKMNGLISVYFCNGKRLNTSVMGDELPFGYADVQTHLPCIVCLQDFVFFLKIVFFSKSSVYV